MNRSEIAALLASIGAPGEKRVEKIEAVEKLKLTNSQGFNVSSTLESYKEF